MLGEYSRVGEHIQGIFKVRGRFRKMVGSRPAGLNILALTSKIPTFNQSNKLLTNLCK